MSAMEIFGWTLATLGAVGVVAWLIHELRNAPTLDESTPLDELMDPAAKAAAKFTRAGWTEVEPGYWVKDTEAECALEDIPNADPEFIAEALAYINNLPTTTEGAES